MRRSATDERVPVGPPCVTVALGSFYEDPIGLLDRPAPKARDDDTPPATAEYDLDTASC